MKIFRHLLVLTLSRALFFGCASQVHTPSSVQPFATRADGTQTYIIKSPIHQDSVDSQSSLKKVMYQQALDFCSSLQANHQSNAILDRLSTREDNLEMVFICE